MYQLQKASYQAEIDSAWYKEITRYMLQYSSCELYPSTRYQLFTKVTGTQEYI